MKRVINWNGHRKYSENEFPCKKTFEAFAKYWGCEITHERE